MIGLFKRATRRTGTDNDDLVLAASRGRGETREGRDRLGESNHFSRRDVSMDGDEMHKGSLRATISRCDSRGQGSDRQGHTFFGRVFSLSTQSLPPHSLNATSQKIKDDGSKFMWNEASSVVGDLFVYKC